MSTAAKLTLAGTTAGAIGIVIFVHLQQKLDKAVSFYDIYVMAIRCTVLIRTYSRRCTRVSFETWNSKRSRGRDRRTLKCRGNWRSNTGRCRMSVTARMDKYVGRSIGRGYRALRDALLVRYEACRCRQGGSHSALPLSGSGFF